MNFFLLAAVAISVIILFKIASFVYANYIERKKFSHVPAIKSYPIIGSLLVILKHMEDHLTWYLSLTDKFKEGMFLHWLAHQPILNVYKPELLQVILSSTIHVEKAQNYNFYKAWLGNGLLTSPAKQWQRDRKLLIPSFHFNVLEQFATTMIEKTETLINRLEKEITENPEKAINIIPFIDNFTLDTICETVMGINIQQQEMKSKYNMITNRCLKMTMQRVVRPWFWSDWIYYLTRTGKKYREVLNDLHEFTKKVIQEKKFMRNSKQNSKLHDTQDNSYSQAELDKPKRKAFLDILLNLNENENNSLTDEEIRAQVDTFMFAGQETTATAIIWTLFCLGHNPDHQERLHEELEEVFKDSQSPVFVKDLPKLKYLERVMKEALRIYPSIPLIMRKLENDVKMGDYLIPKDTSISIFIFLLHRNPAVWPNPMKFDPDRFLPDNIKCMHPYAYIPFSAGPRNCIGQKYALLEQKIVLTTILRKWKVKSVEAPENIVMNAANVLRPRDGMIHLYFSPKQ